jgi:hypothetical protein
MTHEYLAVQETIVSFKWRVTFKQNTTKKPKVSPSKSANYLALPDTCMTGKYTGGRTDRARHSV